MLWTDKAKKILEKYWGFSELKDKQINVINELLLGNDVIGLLPTGYGKSMCYLIPPLVTKKAILIISPLISLMDDQKEKLVEKNIPVAALHGNNKNKDKDLFELWKHFDNTVDVYASIDHYGKRAEYIRHGTDWTVVEENFINAKKMPNIRLQISTVLSVFNLLTIHEFYQYLIDKKLYTLNDSTYPLYNMTHPTFLSPNILPNEYRIKGKESLEKFIDILNKNNFPGHPKSQPTQSLEWLLSSQDTWEQHKDEFRREIHRIDNLRGEDFCKTFPELAGLL
jgi:hypothetical protein